MSSQTEKKTVKSGPSANVVRTKAKPKVNPVTGANFEFANDPRIGDAFVIVIAAPSGVQSLTFHHPIGVADVDGDDWVCTPVGDIPSLLSRKDDPDEADRKAKRDKHRLDLAVAAKLLLKDGNGGQLIYPDTEISRQDALVTARAAAKDAVKAEKGKPSPDLYVRFLPHGVQEKELAIREFLARKSTIQAAETQFPSSGFRTRAGPLADRDQEAVDYLSGESRSQAIDAVVKRIFGSGDEDEE